MAWYNNFVSVKLTFPMSLIIIKELSNFILPFCDSINSFPVSINLLLANEFILITIRSVIQEGGNWAELLAEDCYKG